MEYQKFIEAVEECQTKKIKSVNIPESSCPDTIPSVFSMLIPDIVQVLDKHFTELADGMSHIGIFGLQPTGLTLQSELPIEKDRIISATRIRSHLCCVLYFLPFNSRHAITHWNHYKSIVIDFTKGLIIDEARYLHTVIHTTQLGKIFGRINQKKLAYVWQQTYNNIYKLHYQP